MHSETSIAATARNSNTKMSFHGAFKNRRVNSFSPASMCLDLATNGRQEVKLQAASLEKQGTQLQSIDGRAATKPVREGGKALDLIEPSSGELGELVEAAPKAMANLPRPLSISDLSPCPMHGSVLRVAYQGVSGAYSEAAASKAYPQCEPVPCEQFEVAFQAVELWLADRAVLPVENSLGGSIHRNYDLLLRHRLHIVGEVQLPVHHCLLAMPGVKKEQLRRVISHPQALAQCEQTLSRIGLVKVAREAVDDTAGAAQFIVDNNLRDTAAIASYRAAEIYGLQVMADGIQDDPSNVTRFVALAREPIIPRTDRPFKTSIVFANEEATGALFKVLSAFAFRNINLTKIESRPQRRRPMRVVDNTNQGTAKYFEYLFYIDLEASMADPRAQSALAALQECTTFLRVLGSYPMDTTPLMPSPSPPSSGPL